MPWVPCGDLLPGETGDTTDRGKIGTRSNIRDIAIPLQMP